MSHHSHPSRHRILIAVALLGLLIPSSALVAAEKVTNALPVRAFCIPAPSPQKVGTFIDFITNDLAPQGVNTLILRVDYSFQFKSRPEMADPNGLSADHARQLADACKKHQIQLIPLVNLLGHQSWASSCGRLLQVHPELDETPHVKFPDKYKWPNPDKLYCKSYCPLHPKVHEIVLPLVDEVCQAFNADAFHAGMDEVFYIGEDQCPRCKGKNRGELFGNEVKTIRNHLQKSGRQLWIWADRLIDGKTTGIGEWEASLNDTHTAIDIIPQDVVLCDWHYERADPTPAYFATKGFSVISCSWRNPEVAALQVQDMRRFRAQSTSVMQKRFLGVMQTVWSGSDSFLDEYYGRKQVKDSKKPGHTEANCFRRMSAEWSAVGKE